MTLPRQPFSRWPAPHSGWMADRVRTLTRKHDDDISFGDKLVLVILEEDSSEMMRATLLPVPNMHSERSTCGLPRTIRPSAGPPRTRIPSIMPGRGTLTLAFDRGTASVPPSIQRRSWLGYYQKVGESSSDGEGDVSMPFPAGGTVFRITEWTKYVGKVERSRGTASLGWEDAVEESLELHGSGVSKVLRLEMQCESKGG